MTHRHLIWLMMAATFGARIARGEPVRQRPDLTVAVPIATCKLQTVSAPVAPQYDQAAIGLYTISRPADDPLANYQRTPLGDWPVPAEADRNDPWLRLVLLSRKRPVVIDLAVFIDGRSFRDSREAWIDDVIAAAKSPVGRELGAERQAEVAHDEGTGGEAGSGNNNSPPQGTNTADPASEDDASRASPGAENQATLGLRRAPSSRAATVAAQPRQAPTMRERLMSYLAMSGAEADRAEIGWLLSEWGAGPGIVLLAPALSWQRAGVAPMETYLDQDVDGALSPAEIGQVEALLNRADFNGDDVVEVSEIRRATSHQSAANSVSGHSLILLLDSKTDWESLAATFDKVYGEEGGASAGDPRGLLAVPADITLRVDFSTMEDENRASGASVVSIGQGLSASSEAVVASNDVLSLDVAGDFIEFSAAGATLSKNDSASASQIAIGAVIDGNPLLRLVDRDQDARLTLRERQDLPALLAELDRDADGSVSSAEIPTPILLAVTLGPHVHELLAAPVGAVRNIAPRDAAVPPPDWFASMDKNQDGDLSRGEFLGTTEQFRQFDKDGDGLLSIAEAMKLDNGE
ncbi:MAG TPA: hypothetical protein VJ828_00965 [Lacipirellulaceae bacterium]|nr:hypothetical protein [Lacipirellulaceae bacterium]